MWLSKCIVSGQHNLIVNMYVRVYHIMECLHLNRTLQERLHNGDELMCNAKEVAVFGVIFNRPWDEIIL